MKKLLQYYQKTFGILNFVTFLLLVMSLAFPWRFTQPLFVIWLVAWLLEGRMLNRTNWQWRKALIPIILLGAFVIWEAISLLWTQDPASGTADLGRHLPIFAILLVAVFGANEHYKTYRIKTALIIGSLLSIVCYGLICYQHYLTGTLSWNPPHWFTNNVWALFGEGPIDFLKHRCHYCIILLFSIVFSIDVFRHFRERYSALTAGLTIGIADLLMMAAIVLTGSRIAMFLLPIVAIVLVIKNYHGQWRKAVITGICIVYAALIAIGVTYNVRLISVKNDLTELMSKDESAVQHTTEPRLEIYSCALRHWNEYGFFGVGFGASHHKLNELYAEDGLERCIQNGYGAHNRYLKVWMEMGPLALIAMLFILISAPFFHTGRARQDALFMSIIFGGCMLTENLLTMIGALYILFVLIAIIAFEQREEDSQLLDRP